MRDSVLGTADKFISTTDKQLQEQLKQLHVTLLNLKVRHHVRQRTRRNARPKTKPHHLQRQTRHAHTRVRNPQKLEATAGKKTVAALVFCKTSSAGLFRPDGATLCFPISPHHFEKAKRVAPGMDLADLVGVNSRDWD